MATSKQTVLAFDPKEDARSIEHYRRERSFWQELALIDLDKGKVIASIRFYGSGPTIYCVAWIWPSNLPSARGYGKAGGYGYHKASAAMAEALNAAGVKLALDIGGRGEGVMQEALTALAAHLEIARPYVHHAHA
jgi:hypothetical protein